VRDNRVSRFLNLHWFEGRSFSVDWIAVVLISALVVFTSIKVVRILHAQGSAPVPSPVSDKEIVRVLDPTNEVACYVFRDSGAISCVKFTK